VKDDPAKLKARIEQLQSLHRVSEIIHATLDPQEALHRIVRESVRLVNGASGSVVLVNPTTGFLEIQASQGLPATAKKLKLRIGEGVTGWVARTGKAASIGDVAGDPRYVRLREQAQSELAVPFEVRGEVRGVLNVDSDSPNAFGPGEQELLTALARMAAGVIENTWHYEQLRLKARLFESLAGVSRTINSTLNLDEALEAITREACQLMRVKMCSLMLLDETKQWLELRANFGAGMDYTQKPRLNLAESLIGSVVRRRKPVQVEDVQSSGRYQHVTVARNEGLVSLLSVPLTFTGQAIGALNVYTGQPYKFSDDEVRILTAFAELSAIAIQKARLYERVVDVEEQLRRNEKLSALGLLAAEVAHEIRNPLTVMKMLYHSLDLNFPGGDPRAEDHRVMGEKMDHLNRIVEGILDFARTAEPQFTAVSLNDLVAELALLVRHKLANQNVKLVRELAENLPPVLGDRTQLEQVALNLILNSAEAMPEGGTLTIRTRCQNEHSVVIEFADTGSGMTEEQQRQAFRSLLSTTKAKGTGLGLAIVGRIIDAHHGSACIHSSPGNGTVITIELSVAAHAERTQAGDSSCERQG
jgi:signal transduction histidine kinase